MNDRTGSPGPGDPEQPLSPSRSASPASGSPLLPGPARPRRGRNVTLLTSILIAGALLGTLLVASTAFGRRPGAGAPPVRVPLEAHIMAKCPDARDCLEKLVVPALEQAVDLVDFRLSYIGKINPNSDYGVDCKHGSTECLSNMLGLCAAERYPDPKVYVGFMLCMTAHHATIPAGDVVEACALEHGIEPDLLSDCVSADYGVHSTGLLRQSVSRSIEKNATRSCTVRLDDHRWCVRDGHEWVDCDSHLPDPASNLVAEVKRLYHSRNSLFGI